MIVKTRTTYIAYDDTEFDTEEECREYEQFAIDMMCELCRCYEFKKNDETCKCFVPLSIEDTMSLFEQTVQDCDTVVVHRVPEESALSFQWRQWGFDLPEEEGTYYYDTRYGRWEPVEEY